jgi:hypothetical protein
MPQQGKVGDLHQDQAKVISLEYELPELLSVFTLGGATQNGKCLDRFIRPKKGVGACNCLGHKDSLFLRAILRISILYHEHAGCGPMRVLRIHFLRPECML